MALEHIDFTTGEKKTVSHGWGKPLRVVHLGEALRSFSRSPKWPLLKELSLSFRCSNVAEHIDLLMLFIGFYEVKVLWFTHARDHTGISVLF